MVPTKYRRNMVKIWVLQNLSVIDPAATKFCSGSNGNAPTNSAAPKYADEICR